ncbi:LamG-like jellyroll fold domain-containing protein [Corynebacterium sphenisci]|uniref:LamG-like jellyroll fold domain-containing protein n=1 Tax=Corynebacterium sphenisci TaxID=191493 RepID=UPI0026E03FE7|nr:LamG-like jellyroll fold domain-containing protein [Corynebacterium sphenisci]MDO5730767.1 LamG-like jellyroll fold domain-containing protein [Corynebacterium sphenisci]
MSFVDALTRGAALAVTAGASGPETSRGTLTTLGPVPLAPGLGGDQSMRMTAGHVEVNRTGDITSGDTTVMAWVRVPRSDRGRTVATRAQGDTEISLTVGSDGRPRAVVASARGPYRVALAGAARVDDGNWHQLAVLIDHGSWSRVDITLVVDGVAVRAGQMRPGLFSAAPSMSMTSTVRVGGRSREALLGGDLLALTVHERVVAMEQLAAWWRTRPAGGARSGWGIAFG